MSSSLARAFSRQRKINWLALGLCVAAVWISTPLGKWQAGVFLSVGILLSLVNHLLTERTLLTSVEDGELLTRKQYATSSLVRLLGVSLIAGIVTVAFWPNGALVLFGLALFHVIVLVFSGIPLLKEMKKA